MSESTYGFDGENGPALVTLPLDWRALIEDWGVLRKRMLRDVAPGFSRDEWAYLASFLEPGQLESHFVDNFGQPMAGAVAGSVIRYRPRGEIAVWLPSNVSLLGPLTLVLLSLTGQSLKLKLGSSADDLTGAFLAYAMNRLDKCTLRDYLGSMVVAEVFDRKDPRNLEMARSAQVRIVFGSDAAAEAIHALPHPPGSVGFSFTDRQSQAWLSPGAVDDDVVDSLVRVFTIYGQAGCTSPRKVILLDGTMDDAQALVERLAAAWPRLVRTRLPMHLASDNLKASQWARALGWTTRVLPEHAAVLAHGPIELEPFKGLMSLMIQPATRDQAFASLPQNIQTVGYALVDPQYPDLLERLDHSNVLRYVPLGQMHHFSSTWDGQAFWKGCFEEMDCR